MLITSVAFCVEDEARENPVLRDKCCLHRDTARSSRGSVCPAKRTENCGVIFRLPAADRTFAGIGIKLNSDCCAKAMEAIIVPANNTGQIARHTLFPMTYLFLNSTIVKPY